MDFNLSDDQRMLVDSVQSFVRKESPVERFRKLRDEDSIGWSRDVMKKLGELGWLAIPFAEDVGGLGGSFLDVALLLEVFGTTLVPEPYLASVVLAGAAIARAGSPDQRARFLPTVIDGTRVLAFAYAEDGGRYDLNRVTLHAEKTATGPLSRWRLRGEKRWVLDGHAADAFVVSARTGGEVDARDGISLFVVDRDTPGLSIRTVRTMDGRRAAMLGFDGVEVAADRLLGDEGNALPAIEWVIDRAAAAACAEGLGVMSTALSITRDYLCQREQFGVKIGTFQALQHRCVDMFVETELAKGTNILAAIRADDPDPRARSRAVSIGKVQLATGGKLVVQQSVQLHGGIGVTDEADIGLFFKRMHVLNALFGDEEWHLARVL